MHALDRKSSGTKSGQNAIKYLRRLADMIEAGECSVDCCEMSNQSGTPEPVFSGGKRIGAKRYTGWDGKLVVEFVKPGEYVTEIH